MGAEAALSVVGEPGPEDGRMMIGGTPPVEAGTSASVDVAGAVKVL